MDIELVPLCEVTATLAEPIVLKGAVSAAASPTRSSTPAWRIRATMAGSAGGDWLLVAADEGGRSMSASRC